MRTSRSQRLCTTSTPVGRWEATGRGRAHTCLDWWRNEDDGVVGAAAWAFRAVPKHGDSVLASLCCHVLVVMPVACSPAHGQRLPHHRGGRAGTLPGARVHDRDGLQGAAVTRSCMRPTNSGACTGIGCIRFQRGRDRRWTRA